MTSTGACTRGAYIVRGLAESNRVSGVIKKRDRILWVSVKKRTAEVRTEQAAEMTGEEPRS